MIKHLEDHILAEIGEDIRAEKDIGKKLEFINDISTPLLKVPQGDLLRQLMGEYCSNPIIYKKLGLNPDSEDFYTDARYGAVIAWTRYKRKDKQPCPPIAA